MLNKVNMLIIGDKELSQDMEDKLISRYNIFYFNKQFVKKTVEEIKEEVKPKNKNSIKKHDHKESSSVEIKKLKRYSSNP